MKSRAGRRQREVKEAGCGRMEEERDEQGWKGGHREQGEYSAVSALRLTLVLYESCHQTLQRLQQCRCFI